MQEDSQTIPATHRWGVPKRWHVAPRYEIYPYGLLSEYEETPRSEEQLEAEFYSYYRHYHPLEIQALSGELAALHEGDTDAVLQFAHNYGLLGYGCLKEPLQEITESEPLSWIWAHAETARRVLKLLTLLLEQDQGLGQYLASIAEQAPEVGTAFESKWKELAWAFPIDSVTNVFFRHAQGRDPNQYAHWDIEGVGRSITALDSQEQREIAWHVVFRSINANMEAVIPQLLMTDEGVPRRGFQDRHGFPELAPITVIYIHLQDLAAGLGQFGECKRCGKLFTLLGDKKGPKPNYCPRSDGTKGDSFCSQRARTERWRNKSKGGSDG